MSRRVSRDFDRLSEAQLIAGRTAARRVYVDKLAPPSGTKSIGELLDAIDHVAEAATGERSFLHLAPDPIGIARRRA